MKLWLISLVISVLALGGIVIAASTGFQDTTKNEETTTTSCGYADSQGGCSYQNQDCSSKDNCDIESCAAVQETGSCNCGN